MMDVSSWDAALRTVAWPSVKLVAAVAVGVLVGNLIEASPWSRWLARMARPVARMGRFCDVSAASFAVAFVSGYTANTMLASAYEEGRISRRELILSNLFNSLPTYFLHLPTMVFMTVPLIGRAAVVYLSITVGAALLRTCGVLGVARLLLGGLGRCCLEETALPPAPQDLAGVLRAAWKRFRRRIGKIVAITVPVYLAFQGLHASGAFHWLESRIVDYLGSALIPPQAMSVVLFQLAAEFSAGMAAAGALLDAAALPERQVVLALVVGNIVSSPMRAFRHQFPYYAGIFAPRLALELITASQAFRVLSLVLCGGIYAWLTA